MDIKIFSINDSPLGERIARNLGIKLSQYEERFFDDGEVYCASLENVRGRDVYVVCDGFYGNGLESVNDVLVKLLIFIGALKDASAHRITLVAPMFPYSRQDRKTASRAPITTKYLAKCLQGVGLDRIITMEAHNPGALQNAYDISVDLLEANGLFASYISQNFKVPPKDLVIMSPDSGGLSRLRRFRPYLEARIGCGIEMACMDKIHTDKEIKASSIIGNVKGKKIIVIDDMISSGKTISELAKISESVGAIEVLAACATHGLFVGKANKNLSSNFIKNIIVSDTINKSDFSEIKSKIRVLDTSDIFSQAIKRTHYSESISDLIERNDFCAKVL